ncbi:MAG: hypothetical protein IKR45_05110 [Treponema sp.]|nr:hypothetical protein [Treponema sp.]
MKKACNVLDYDFYSFDYPLSKVGFAKEKRNSFICSQLEKMHPCFSDDCCFDYKLRLNKNKLRADVVVMQKFRLAEYKNQRKKIYIPEGKMTAFYSRAKVWVFVVCILLLLLCVIAVAGSLMPGGDSQEQAFSDNVAEPSYSMENQTQSLELVELVRTLGGTVDSIYWETDGFTEKITLATQRIFPEQILQVFPQANFSSLTFDSLVPQLTIQITARVNNGIGGEQTSRLPQFMSRFRRLLMENDNGAFIMEETVKPHSIKFSLRQDIKDGTEKILGVLDEEKICVSSLVLKKQADEILFEIVFSDVEFTNQDKLFQKLLDNVGLFFEEQGAVLESRHEIAPSSASSKTQENTAFRDQDYTLIGKIMHGGEHVTEYYKTPEGKIIKKER